MHLIIRKKRRRTFRIFFFLTVCQLSLFSHLRAVSQQKFADSIAKKMSNYSLEHPSAVLFCDFDKTIYTPGENVWFAAYLLEQFSYRISPDVLSVTLINESNNSIILEKKFLMHNRISSGNIFLPDSLGPGAYSILLYPNRILKDGPVDFFIQHITIKSVNQPDFKVSLRLLDTGSETSKSAHVLVNVANNTNQPLSNASVRYSFGNKVGSFITDAAGNGSIQIPTKDTSVRGQILNTKVEYGKKIENIDLPLSLSKKKLSVKFYPEGGYLVHATFGWVGWETKRYTGEPLKCRGVLFKDDKPIDTISTDSYGMGRFHLVPLRGSRYTLKLLSEDFRDSVFKLPEIVAKSPAIEISNAVVGDSLRIAIKSKYPETVSVIVHNYRQIFYAFQENATAVGKRLVIGLKDVPKGLATVTILDNMFRPCAERLFFAHYDKRSRINITTNKAEYAKRELVKISLKFQTPDTGLVSVACVQTNRLQIKNRNNIESYVYLQHDLDAIPLKDSYMGENEIDRGFLENVLLIRGWRRYRWQEMIQTPDSDSTLRPKLIDLNGVVTRSGRLLKKPVKLVVMSDSTVNTLTSDSKGAFVLTANTIVTEANKKIRFLVMDKNVNDFDINVADPYNKITRQLLLKCNKLNTLANFGIDLFNSDSLTINGLEHTIALKEVKIKGYKDNSLLSSNITNFSNPHRNECGDYVCRYNVLNCPNHPNESDNKPAAVGHFYRSSNTTGETIVYKGCTTSNVKTDNVKTFVIDGVIYPSEFYGSDYSVLNPSTPEYVSTLFWKSFLKVNSKGESQLSFYTSDIKGPFKIVVQGITTNDVVYGEKDFLVK